MLVPSSAQAAHQPTAALAIDSTPRIGTTTRVQPGVPATKGMPINTAPDTAYRTRNVGPRFGLMFTASLPNW